MSVYIYIYLVNSIYNIMFKGKILRVLFQKNIRNKLWRFIISC